MNSCAASGTFCSAAGTCTSGSRERPDLERRAWCWRRPATVCSGTGSCARTGPTAFGRCWAVPTGGGRSGGGACPIIIIDDCDIREQARIWSELKGSNAARLVTIHSEDVGCGPDCVHMPVPPLADAQVREILSTYAGAEPDLGAWCEYCRASPRAAHVVGSNLKHGPDNMLRSPNTVAVWRRYISGQNGLD